MVKLYKTADMYVLPSKCEGLNVSLMEAKAAGCELRASMIRGNIDILVEEDIYNFDYRRINCRMKEYIKKQ
jgi:glycosyltransferase involved in cell wall biosynthesis